MTFAAQSPLAERGPSAVYAFLDPHLRFVQGDVALAALGGGAPPLDGRPLADALPTLAPALAPLLQQALAGHEATVDAEIAAQDGGSAPYSRWHVNVRAVRTRGGHLLGVDLLLRPHGEAQSPAGSEASGSDAALQLRLTEATLARSEARLAGIIESAMDAIITVDESQRVVGWNAAAERIFRCPASAAVGTTLDRFIPEAARERHREHIRRFHDTGTTARSMGGLHTLSAVRADGEQFPIEASISQLALGGERLFTVILRDTTVRVQAEGEREQLLLREQRALEATRRAMERVSQLQEVTAALVETLTPEQVAVVIVDHAARAFHAKAVSLALVGAQGDELALVYAVGHPQETLDDWGVISTRWASPLSDAVHTGQAIFLESRAATAAAYPMQGEMQATSDEAAWAALPLLAHGRAIGVLHLAFHEERPFDDDERALMLALTRQGAVALERARLYLTEHEARTAAEAAVRLREEFLSVASHELKTPLTVLLGSAQAYQLRNQRMGTLSERDAQGIGRVVQQGQRLDRMINRLLDVSRIEQGRLQLEFGTLDLSALVQRVAMELYGDSRRHRFLIRGAEEPVLIAGDELRLEQVVQNLLGNAIKYSPRGGTVTITLAPAGEAVQLTVQDEGLGIPQEELPRIIERFYRASNVSGTHISGVGIGLYVVQEIVGLHGGRLTVTSEENMGSAFSVTLPQKAAPTTRAADAP